MGPLCSSAETQVCHRSYIIAANVINVPKCNQYFVFAMKSGRFAFRKRIRPDAEILMNRSIRIKIYVSNAH
jgi:hypothetical protein